MAKKHWTDGMLPEKIEARRVYMRVKALEWNRAHPERKRENAARYRARHRKDENRRIAAWRQVHPWYNQLQQARHRCENTKHKSYRYYGARGIKFRLSPTDMEFLWQRDNAAALRQASIDRVDPDGDYCLENCRIIEFSENVRLSHAYRTKIFPFRRPGPKTGAKAFPGATETACA